ncbi:MAG: alcohol dehydrogenase catalytic domain-containing protein [Desulfobacterales bacterium]|nr:alcohol dehydrogenase catalytic domain-containing protein [Desulfobacterales bacterium]
MKAIVLNGPNDFSLQDIEDPIPTAEEVEIQVRMAGICGTDIHLLRGKNPFAAYPLIPGHEYMGEIVSLPAQSDLKKGDRVTVFPAEGCGTCEACKAGRLPHCTEFKFIGVRLPGGCFAEKVVADYRRIFPLPGGMEDEVGAMVEPTAVAVHANRRADLGKGMKVLVIGGGTIGLLIAQVAQVYGASQVIVSEPLDERRSLARHMGLELTCNPQDEDLVAFAKRNMGMADVVFDAVGTQKTVTDAGEILRPGGHLMLIALPHIENLGISYRTIFAKELKAIGSRTYFMDDFPEAIRLLGTGHVTVRPLISKILALDRFAEGVELLEREPEKYIKVLINPALSAEGRDLQKPK